MHDVEGLLLGLTAALGWGLADTVATVASRRVGSLRAVAGTQLTSVVVLAILVLAHAGPPCPTSRPSSRSRSSAGWWRPSAYLAFFTALRHGPISVVSPVVSTYGGLTVVLSVLLLGESLAPAQVLGVVVATTAIVLASVTLEGGLRRARPAGPGVASPRRPRCLRRRSPSSWRARSVRRAGCRSSSWPGSRTPGSIWTILGVSRLRRAVGRRPAGQAPVDRRSIVLVVVVGLLDVGAFIAFAVGLEIAPTWLVGHHQLVRPGDRRGGRGARLRGAAAAGAVAGPGPRRRPASS